MVELLFYTLGSMVIAVIWAPLLINILIKLHVTRNLKKDFSSLVGERHLKSGTPIMGGLLIVVTVAIITLLFNLNGFTKIPLLVMLLSAGLGGLDDLLNIFGKKRIIRSTKKHIKLAKIHKNKWKRILLWIALPWNMYQNMWFTLGSYPGTGIHAGEKIIVQIFTGAAVAWWLWWKLGWSTVWIPIMDYNLDIGWLMPIFIIFTIVSMANAVNIADGMDGLASGISLIVFIAFLIIAQDAQGEIGPVMSNYLGTVIGALIAYTYFNIKPARFQMGDVGSLAIGAMIATVAFALNKALLLPIIGFVFVAIIGSSLIQSIYRRVTGMRLFKMAPIHLHFQIVGWSEEKIVMRFWIFGIVSALIGLLINYL